MTVTDALRLCAGLATLAWVSSWLTLHTVVAGAIDIEWNGVFPWWLAEPGLAVVPWVGVPLLGLLAVVWPAWLRLHAWAWLGATVYLAGHEILLANAAFHGGIWVALWQVWAVEAARRDPQRVIAFGPLLAVIACAALFLPAATGKFVAGYVDGSWWTVLARDKNASLIELFTGVDPWHHPAAGPVFARVALVGELSIGVAWLAPVRPALWWVVAMLTSMHVVWTWALWPITGQVLGMVVAALVLTRARPLTAR